MLSAAGALLRIQGAARRGMASHPSCLEAGTREACGVTKDVSSWAARRWWTERRADGKGVPEHRAHVGKRWAGRRHPCFVWLGQAGASGEVLIQGKEGMLRKGENNARNTRKLRDTRTIR